VKTSLDFEQCGGGWKVLAHVEDVTTEAELLHAQGLIESAAQFSMALPGWDLKKTAGEEDTSQDKWRKAAFARRQWAKGLTK